MLQQFITTKRAYFADLYAHLGRRGVAGNGAVALHALTAIAVGECQPLLQLGRGGGGQAVRGYAVAAKLPQERPDEAVPRAGGVHGLDRLDGGKSLGRAGVGVGPGAAAGLDHQLHMPGEQFGQGLFDIGCAGQKLQFLIGHF